LIDQNVNNTANRLLSRNRTTEDVVGESINLLALLKKRDNFDELLLPNQTLMFYAQVVQTSSMYVSKFELLLADDTS
jgi:hypothetical protein